MKMRTKRMKAIMNHQIILMKMKPKSDYHYTNST